MGWGEAAVWLGLGVVLPFGIWCWFEWREHRHEREARARLREIRRRLGGVYVGPKRVEWRGFCDRLGGER